MEEGIELKGRWLKEMIEKYGVEWEVLKGYPKGGTPFATFTQFKTLFLKDEKHMRIGEINHTMETISLHPILFSNADIRMFKDTVLHEIAHYLARRWAHKHTVSWYRAYLQMCENEGLSPISRANGTTVVDIDMEKQILIPWEKKVKE